MAFTVDIPEDIDQMDRGNFPDPGWVKVKHEDATVNDSDGATDLEFVIIAPPHQAGLKVKQKLFDPDLADSDEHKKKSLGKLNGWAKRMGVVTPEDAGKKGFALDFVRTLGNEYMMKLEKTTNKTTGKRFTGPAYMGIYPFTHEEIPDDVRSAFQLPPAIKKNPTKATKTTPQATPAAAQADLADLM